MSVLEDLKELRYAWRVMWKLGGPIHVFVYELTGSLDRRIDDLRNRGPCYDYCACRLCWDGWGRIPYRTRLAWRIKYIFDNLRGKGWHC